MQDFSFKKTTRGYVAHFEVLGVITLHIEFNEPANSIIGIRSSDSGTYNDVYVTSNNPLDGDFRIGDGNKKKYVEIRCTKEPSSAQYDGDDVTPFEED